MMLILADLPDHALTTRLLEIRKHERSLLVELLGLLAELDRRRTVLALGFSSLFSFCTDRLGLTKASAFRRTTAARLLARFPVIAEFLADGRLNLTTLVELRDVLDEAHATEILDRAAGRTEDQVKELVAALRPQPAPPDLLRKLPTQRNDSGGSGPELFPGSTDHRAKEVSLPAAPPPPAAPTPAANAQPAPAPARPSAGPAARLQPIAPERHVLRVTVDATFVADLEAVRQALSHKLPGAGLEVVLHECLRITLSRVEGRRRGSGKKTSAKAPPPGSRYVPAAIRHEVWTRDGGQCAFVGSTGQRCTSRHQLELHHVDPFASGRRQTTANLTLRCRAHNRHEAEQDFGREHIARKVAARHIGDGATGAPADGRDDPRVRASPGGDHAWPAPPAGAGSLRVMALRATVRGGRLIVDEPTDSPEGTEVPLLPLDSW
jgi:5-methylcytosine-specific restriction endonuclease McrA